MIGSWHLTVKRSSYGHKMTFRDTTNVTTHVTVNTNVCVTTYVTVVATLSSHGCLLSPIFWSVVYVFRNKWYGLTGVWLWQIGYICCVRQTFCRQKNECVWECFLRDRWSQCVQCTLYSATLKTVRDFTRATEMIYNLTFDSSKANTSTKRFWFL